MGLEIDFLSVGEGEKSGDAIALRYGNLFGPRSEQTVLVIDGGTPRFRRKARRTREDFLRDRVRQRRNLYAP